MKVRLTKTFAGPDGTGQAGDTIDLPDKQARALIKGDAAETVEEPAGEPAPGSLTMAGSFGGTPAGLDTSGQTPGVAAPAPDPLLPPEAHADGLAVGTDVADAPKPEDVVNRDAIQEAAAPEDEPRTGRKKH
jgi:hypothetical protein